MIPPHNKLGTGNAKALGSSGKVAPYLSVASFNFFREAS